MSLAGLIGVIFSLEEVFDRLGLRRSYGGAIAYHYNLQQLRSDANVLLTDESIDELESLLARFG